MTEDGVRVTRAIISEIPFFPNKKVLDAACGVSMFGKTLSDNVYGFDVNPEAVRVSRRKGIKAKLGDVVKKWSYPDKFFDIVILSHIIEHVEDPDHLILEAKRVLKKGGLVIIITPNLAAWFNRIFLLLGYQPFFTEVSTVDKTLGMKFTRKVTSTRSPLGHLRTFTAGSLPDIIELHGFKTLMKRGSEFVAFPKPFLYLDMVFARCYSLASIILVVGKKI